MATRGATGIIEERDEVHSPDGIKPKSCRPSDGTVVVKLDTIHSPSLLLQGEQIHKNLLQKPIDSRVIS